MSTSDRSYLSINYLLAFSFQNRCAFGLYPSLFIRNVFVFACLNVFFLQTSPTSGNSKSTLCFFPSRVKIRTSLLTELEATHPLFCRNGANMVRFLINLSVKLNQTACAKKRLCSEVTKVRSKQLPLPVPCKFLLKSAQSLRSLLRGKERCSKLQAKKGKAINTEL